MLKNPQVKKFLPGKEIYVRNDKIISELALSLLGACVGSIFLDCDQRGSKSILY
jgi:hypothetical protein